MGYFQFSFYFHFPLLFFFDFEGIFHNIVIIKIKINVLWEIPVKASLSRAPQTFRTMDRWSSSNESLRKGLLIYILLIYSTLSVFHCHQFLRCFEVFWAFLLLGGNSACMLIRGKCYNSWLKKLLTTTTK